MEEERVVFEVESKDFLYSLDEPHLKGYHPCFSRHLTQAAELRII
jgi:hypothetical protein